VLELALGNGGATPNAQTSRITQCTRWERTVNNMRCTLTALTVAIASVGVVAGRVARSAEMDEKRTAGPTAAAVTSAPAPEGEPLSGHYALTVGGRSVPVYACRVSAMPFNQVWPGYQRPLDQTETAGFAYWDMGGPARVEIRSLRPVESVVVRPASLGIAPSVEDDRIAFDLDRPRHLVVEVNGLHHALHLFASPPERDAPSPGSPDVRYFGPGVHRPGRITLKSNDTVYLAAGAVVYGSLHANAASNIRVCGRGILDVAPFERGEGGGAIRLTDCSDVVIDGIVMRDPDVWCCSLFGCRDAVISNVKLIGLWRYNADGIDVCNSQDVVVEDSFVRAFDDALVIKGLKFGQESLDGRPVKNVVFRRCVVWCDWGRAMEIGAETCAPEISDVVFEDCDIIRTTHIAMDIQHGDRAAVRNIRFQDIRVEVDKLNLPPRMQSGPEDRYGLKADESYLPRLLVIEIRGTNYSKDGQRGTVRDVLFRDLAVIGPRMPESVFRGFDAEHTVEGVTIQGLRLNGRQVGNAADAQLAVGPHVSEVRFADSAAGRE
jgi:hypothetical protein